MEITARFTTRQSIKELRNWLNITNQQDWDMSCFSEELYRMQLIDMKTQELEFLVDVYTHITPDEYKEQIDLIKAELEFRKTPVGRELY